MFYTWSGLFYTWSVVSNTGLEIVYILGAGLQAKKSWSQKTQEVKGAGCFFLFFNWDPLKVHKYRQKFKYLNWNPLKM